MIPFLDLCTINNLVIQMKDFAQFVNIPLEDLINRKDMVLNSGWSDLDKLKK